MFEMIDDQIMTIFFHIREIHTSGYTWKFSIAYSICQFGIIA